MQHAWEFIAAIQFDGTTIYYRRMRMRVRAQLDPLGHWITIASKQNTQTQTMELKRNKRINTLVNCECVYIVNCIHRSIYAGVMCVFFLVFLCVYRILLSCTFNRWFRDNVIISMNVPWKSTHRMSTVEWTNGRWIYACLGIERTRPQVYENWINLCIESVFILRNWISQPKEFRFCTANGGKKNANKIIALITWFNPFAVHSILNGFCISFHFSSLQLISVNHFTLII